MWVRNKDIDIGLAIIERVEARFGYGPIQRKLIAEICGCNPKSILNIEKRALQKVRWRAKEIYEKSCC